mgnify:CR=1 FL=1
MPLLSDEAKWAPALLPLSRATDHIDSWRDVGIGLGVVDQSLRVGQREHLEAMSLTPIIGVMPILAFEAEVGELLFGGGSAALMAFEPHLAVVVDRLGRNPWP